MLARHIKFYKRLSKYRTRNRYPLSLYFPFKREFNVYIRLYSNISKSHVFQPKISNFDEYAFNSLDIIRFEEFESILSSLLPKSTKSIVVGVSGGPDSILLSILSSKYCNKYNIPLYCITIDHMLREESTKEAEIVHEWMSKLNINHTIRRLDWMENSKINMKEAREFRYKQLKQFLCEMESNVLLTGHHLNDNNETLFIRISSGSGIDGLACIPSRRKIGDNMLIVRPFLKFTKDQIISTCISYNQPWIEDRSNVNENYQRVRVRNGLKALKEHHNVNEYDINYLIETFVQARALFLDKSKQFLDSHSIMNKDYGYIQINYNEFQNLNELDARHVLSSIIHIVSGKKMKKMNSILTAVKRIKSSNFNSLTLHHCWILLHDKNSLIICLAPLPLDKYESINYGECIAWRKSWKIHYFQKYKNYDRLIIRQINETDINILKNQYKEEYKKLKSNIPFPVLLSLPIIVTEEGHFVEFLLSKQFISVSFSPHDFEESQFV